MPQHRDPLSRLVHGRPTTFHSTVVYRLLIATALILGGCADPNATARLTTDIKAVEDEIKDANAELQKYGDGSVLYALVSVRLAVHNQTHAMLTQKWAAVRWYPKFSYTVDGKVYEAPADTTKRLEELRSALAHAEKGAFEARLKALGSGGLIGAIASMTAELKALPVAQIEYQILALEHGFPPFGAQIKLPEESRGVQK